METRLDDYVVDDDDADHDEEDGDDDDDADANDAQEMMLEIKPKAEHMLPQTFGEDSEMLAEDLYYHRVLIWIQIFKATVQNAEQISTIRWDKSCRAV